VGLTLRGSAAKVFRTVINYLRSQCTQLVVEESNKGKLRAILAEAEYYQVSGAAPPPPHVLPRPTPLRLHMTPTQLPARCLTQAMQVEPLIEELNKLVERVEAKEKQEREEHARRNDSSFAAKIRPTSAPAPGPGGAVAPPAQGPVPDNAPIPTVLHPRHPSLLSLTGLDCQTVLKLPCWAYGADPATLERARARAC